MLYLIPTPIGNLEDITLRALRILKEVDLILAEDTRTSKKLLQHYDISSPLKSYHAHNEHATTTSIIEQLQEGRKIALISDAGTPGISDPGFYLVRACIHAEIPVTCLPGATALIPALVGAGLPTDKFHFEGFLPHKKGRQTRIQLLAELPTTFVLYESPHRLLKALQQLETACGPDRRAVAVRELTKIHEEFARGTLQELIALFEARPKIKGEIVLVVEGKQKPTKSKYQQN